MAYPSEDPITTYQQGQRITMFVDFVDAAGVAADPDVVLLHYFEGDTEPAITVLQVALSNPSVGRWEFGLNLPQDGDRAGAWTYRFEGTSVDPAGVNSVDEKRFEVEPSPFYPKSA